MTRNIKIRRFFGVTLLCITQYFSNGQCNSIDLNTFNSYSGSGSYLIPCCIASANSASVSSVNYNWTSVFEDDFTGNTLDLSKWLTELTNGGAHNPGPNSNGVFSNIDYATDNNYIFDNPGIELVDRYSATPFWGYASDWNSYDYQQWNFTSGNLKSQYQFPLFNNQYEPAYGIYQLTGTLPQVQEYNGGSSLDPPYPYIWPSFWTWGIDDFNNYGEIDGFEFGGGVGGYDDDLQTSHYPCPPSPTCPKGGCQTYYVNSSLTTQNEQHDFYIIYTAICLR